MADPHRKLSSQLEIHLLTADTHGKQDEIDRELNVKAHRIRTGNEAEEKGHYVRQLGAESVVAVGNGANDVAMMDHAELSIAVLGPEGLSTETLKMADVVVRDTKNALDLLLNPKRLLATLRR